VLVAIVDSNESTTIEIIKFVDTIDVNKLRGCNVCMCDGWNAVATMKTTTVTTTLSRISVLYLFSLMPITEITMDLVRTQVLRVFGMIRSITNTASVLSLRRCADDKQGGI